MLERHERPGPYPGRFFLFHRSPILAETNGAR
jgi:hypothetical protein